MITRANLFSLNTDLTTAAIQSAVDVSALILASA